MSADRDALYALFEQQPGDLTAYGAMGDEMSYLGYEKLAHAFRWMCFRGKFPHHRTNYCDSNNRYQGRKIPKNFAWAWYCDSAWHHDHTIRGVLPTAKRETHSLPRLLLPGKQKAFASHQAAVMFLAEQLAKLNEVYAVNPPQKPGLPLIDVLNRNHGVIDAPKLIFKDDEHGGLQSHTD